MIGKLLARRNMIHGQKLATICLLFMTDILIIFSEKRTKNDYTVLEMIFGHIEYSECSACQLILMFIHNELLHFHKCLLSDFHGRIKCSVY